MNDPSSACPAWSFDHLPSLAGKTVVVTGGSGGIGFAACRTFAATGARVVIAARDPETGFRARSSIADESPGSIVDFVSLDLADLSSIRRCAAELLDRTEAIDLLCNNAGIMAVKYPTKKLTADGFELHIGVNHFGHFALTGLLFDRLAQSAPSRVVTQSSRAHKGRWTFDVDKVARNEGFENAYGVSKLANVLFSKELARRTDAHKIEVASIGCQVKSQRVVYELIGGSVGKPAS
jgi:NAD(P)-dependent dehydrogenase (short-subunit alcohol dehydrogenase family)